MKLLAGGGQQHSDWHRALCRGSRRSRAADASGQPRVTLYRSRARSVAAIRESWLCGALYGLVLYVMMNCIVVPLSAAGPGSKDPLWIALSIVAHGLGLHQLGAFESEQGIGLDEHGGREGA